MQRRGRCTYVVLADESGYWLEVLVEAGEIPPTAARDLLREADELTRIFVASRETIRKRVQAKKSAGSRIHNVKSRI